MLAQIQKLASSFATTTDGTTVLLRLHSDASGVEVLTTTKDNKSMRGVFNESAMQAIKDKSLPELSAEAWFAEVNKALMNNAVNVTGTSLEIDVCSKMVLFALQPDDALNGQQVLLGNLLLSIRIPLRVRDFNRQLEELAGRESEVRITALGLERGQKSLVESIQRSAE